MSQDIDQVVLSLKRLIELQYGKKISIEEAKEIYERGKRLYILPAQLLHDANNAVDSRKKST